MRAGQPIFWLTHSYVGETGPPEASRPTELSGVVLDLHAGHCDPHRQIMNTEHQGIFSMYCILIVVVEVKNIGKLRLLQLGQQIIWTQQKVQFIIFSTK